MSRVGGSEVGMWYADEMQGDRIKIKKIENRQVRDNARWYGTEIRRVLQQGVKERGVCVCIGTDGMEMMNQ